MESQPSIRQSENRKQVGADRPSRALRLTLAGAALLLALAAVAALSTQASAGWAQSNCPLRIIEVDDDYPSSSLLNCQFKTILEVELLPLSSGDVVRVYNGTYLANWTISANGISVVGESTKGVVVYSVAPLTSPFALSGQDINLSTMTLVGANSGATTAGAAARSSLTDLVLQGNNSFAGLFQGPSIVVRNVSVVSSAEGPYFLGSGMDVDGLFVDGALDYKLVVGSPNGRFTNVTLNGSFAGVTGLYIINAASNLTFTNVYIEESQVGISHRIADSTVRIYNLTTLGNTYGISLQGSGALWVDGWNATKYTQGVDTASSATALYLNNTHFASNGYAIWWAGAPQVFVNNSSIQDSPDYGIRHEGSTPLILNNVSFENISTWAVWTTYGAIWRNGSVNGSHNGYWLDWGGVMTEIYNVTFANLMSDAVDLSGNPQGPVIEQCTFVNGTYGFQSFNYAPRMRFVNNTFRDMAYYGAYLIGEFMTIQGNTFNNTSLPLRLQLTDGLSPQNWNNVTTDNLIDGNPVYYILNATGVTVPPNASLVFVINSTNITVSGINQTVLNDQGVWITESTNVTVADSRVLANGGVYASTSRRVVISNVTTMAPWSWYGFQAYRSNDVLVDGLVALSQNPNGLAVQLSESSNITARNVFAYMANMAFYFYLVDGANLTNISAVGDGWMGLYIESSSRLNFDTVLLINGTIQMTYSTRISLANAIQINSTGFGVQSYQSIFVNLTNVTILNPNGEGMWLDLSSNWTVRNSTFAVENYGAVYMVNSPDYRTYNSTYVSINSTSMAIDAGSFNFVAFHNNFYGGAINNPNNYGVWDAGYPAGGNYYDYAVAGFTDLFTAAGQNSVPGRDGIKDAPPYPVSPGRNDNYALMSPWPPKVTLVDPPSGSLIRAGTVLNFTISNFFDAVTWSDNVTGGQAAFPFPHDINTTGWADGWNTITVRGTDSTILNRSLAVPNVTLTFEFEFDSTAPLFVVSPVALGAPAMTDQEVLDIDVVEPHLFSWSYTIDNITTVNDTVPAQLDLSDSGYDLSPGPHLIVLTATDLLGNNRTFFWYFYVDAFAPALLRMNPSEDYFQPGMVIEYMASDDNLMTSLVFTATEQSALWSYSGNLTLGSTNWEIDTSTFQDGCYNLDVFATDEAAHITVDTWAFCVDSSNPDLSGFPFVALAVEDIGYGFDAGPLNDLDWDPTIQWTFFDESSIVLFGWNPTHTFQTPGNYSVHLRVTDRAANFAEIDFTLSVEDVTSPVADFALNATIPEDIEVSLDAAPSTDNDGEWNGGATGRFHWDIIGTNYSLALDGRLVPWNATQPGSYNITLTVFDRWNNQDSITRAVVVRDTTPPSIAVAGFRGPFNETDRVVLDASGSTDNDIGPGLIFQWSFTYNGSAQTIALPVLNFTFVRPGTYAITLRVADRTGVENSTQIFVRINDVPAVTGAPEASVTLPAHYEGHTAVTDTDTGDTIAYSIVSGPAGMTISPAGVIGWSPPAEGYGVYNVVFRVSDGLASVDYAYVLTVRRAPDPTNHAPFFSTFPVQTGLPGAAYSYAVGIGDPDTDDVLSLIVVSGPAGMTVDSSRVVHWTIPASGAGITYSVSLLISDGLESVYQNYTIRARVGDVAPTFTAGKVPTAASVAVGDAYTLVLDATFAADNDDTFDLLTFYATAADGSVVSVSVTHSGTTWTLKVTGLKAGTSRVSLRVADPSGLYAEAPIDVTVTAGAVVAPAGEFPLMLLVLLAALGGAGVLALVVMKRRKKDDGEAAVVAPAPAAPAAPTQVKVPVAPVASAPAAEVVDVEVVAVPAAPVAGAAVGAAARAPPAVPVVAAKPKAATYVVEGLFVIYQDGRMIFSKTDIGRGEALGDPELVSSMFTAVQQFIKDSFSAEGELNKMGYGENQILIERGKSVFMATINFGEPDKELQETMQTACEKMEYTYAGVIEKWDGNAASFQNLDKIVAPILALTAGVTRQDVLAATTTRDVKVLSQLEFFQGFVRLKVGVKNDTEAVITKVTLDIDFNEDVLRLQRIEPASYKTSGARVMLNVLNPGEKSSVAFYFDPQICTETNIDGIVRYRDYKGVLSSVTMKTRKAEVVCPLFFTKEHANTAMLKRLIENELQEKDSKIYTITKLPPYVKHKDIFDVTKSVVLSHDVHMVREFVAYNPFSGEAWFYGETKVKNYKIVIRAAVREDNTIEFFAASTVIKAVTGLLAEFNHTLTSMIVERYSDVKIEQVYDEAKKHEIQNKALIDRLGESEAGAGETEQGG